jgi:hypothetical protein
MKRRELILAAAVAGLLAVLVLRFVWNTYADAVDRRQVDVEKLENELQGKRLAVTKALRTAEELAVLEARSLPSDRNLARTLYQNWLLEQVVAARLRQARVSTSRGQARGDAYYVLPFTVQAHGDLEGLTRLLFAFYNAPHLHRISRLSLKPIENSRELDITLSVEALSLNRADRDDALSALPAERLAPLEPSNFAVVAQRNLFAPYQPPPPPRVVRETPAPPPPARVNDAEYAVVTALIEDGERSQAWINVRTTGKVLKVETGDVVRVGDFNGEVSRIGPRDLEIKLAAGRVLVALGDSLAQGRRLPDEAAQ